MISKPPRRAWPGAWVPAFSAGTVNIVGILGFDHPPVTHLTGTTPLLTRENLWGVYAAAGAPCLLVITGFPCGERSASSQRGPLLDPGVTVTSGDPTG